MGTRRCYDVESTSRMLIQRRNNVVCPVVCLIRVSVRTKADQSVSRVLYLVMTSGH